MNVACFIAMLLFNYDVISYLEELIIKVLCTMNQSNFYFHDAKERMWVAAKNQLVIESAALYCSKPTTRKLPNATTKKNFT